MLKQLRKFGSFIGPGIMISVAYMDPGNYSTDVGAGASNQYSLLFIVLLSNIFAIFLQILCIQLGSVTGFSLARACREYLPKWLNIILWIFAEIAIIATDVAEVIGTAIALNILLHIPLWAGVLLTCADVLLVLMAYRPGSSLKFVKMFEYGVALLVLGVVICLSLELSLIDVSSVGKMFRGFVPSKQMFENGGMIAATGILGATVMPHSLFLGSGIVQSRLRSYDVKEGYYRLPEKEQELDDYKPSVHAIGYGMKYSIIELVVFLFTFALFVNSTLLIISGSTLYGSEEAKSADLYTIHSLLTKSISKGVGTLFMLALLFSGLSAGIVCTLAGQIVSEGHLNWTCAPWKRRLFTRLIAIVPCLAVSLSIGQNALSKALNATQVILSIMLPFLTAPLVYFTSRTKYMTCDGKDFSNGWLVIILGSIIWLFISILNVYSLVQLGLGGGIAG